ncbi:MAG: hypothetical protein K5761_02955 [Clostridiales bacterium]|nr:hypothetical protein [Clostridiales bacterium]
MQSELNKTGKSKIMGIILILFSLFGFFLFIYRITTYKWVYDSVNSPTDYGAYNILSYFTVQSNLIAYIYLLIAGLSALGIKKLQPVGFNETFRLLITLYVLVAGVTYCAGFALGMAPPLEWDTTADSISSFIQIYYHVIMPIVFIFLLFFPFRNKKASKRIVKFCGIYPIVYSLFSLIRGRVMLAILRSGEQEALPPFYPYPFYNPDDIWELYSNTTAPNYVATYIFMAFILALAVAVFMLIARCLIKVHNYRVRKDN